MRTLRISLRLKTSENTDEVEKELERFILTKDRLILIRKIFYNEEFKSIVKKSSHQKTKTTACIEIFPVNSRKYSRKKYQNIT